MRRNLTNRICKHWRRNGLSKPYIECAAFPKRSYLFQGGHIAGPRLFSRRPLYRADSALAISLWKTTPPLSAQVCLWVAIVDDKISLLTGLFCKKCISGGKSRILKDGNRMQHVMRYLGQSHFSLRAWIKTGMHSTWAKLGLCGKSTSCERRKHQSWGVIQRTWKPTSSSDTRTNEPLN